MLCVSLHIDDFTLITHALKRLRDARFDSPGRFRNRAFFDQWVTSVCPRGQPLFTRYTLQCFHVVLDNLSQLPPGCSCASPSSATATASCTKPHRAKHFMIVDEDTLHQANHSQPMASMMSTRLLNSVAVFAVSISARTCRTKRFL